MTKRERIWRWLNRYGPATKREIVEALQISANGVNVSLFHLRNEGYVDRSLTDGQGCAKVGRWFALGKRAPTCMLGMHPNTLRNLNQRRDIAIARLKNAWVARGLDPTKLDRRPEPINDSCLLSQCWTSSKSCKRAA